MTEGRKKDPEVFKDDIRLSPAKLRTVVDYLESVNLSKTDLDSKGRAFRDILGLVFSEVILGNILLHVLL